VSCPASLKPRSLCVASVSAQSQTRFTHCRSDAELVVQPDFGDAVDVAQTLGQLEVCVPLQAALEGADDLGAGQTGATRPAHGQNERPAEALVVAGVELLDVRELLWRAVGEPGPPLFVRALGGQALADHGLAGELGVGAQQFQLPGPRCFPHGRCQCVPQCGQRGKAECRSPGPGGLRDPGRMLIGAVQHGHEAGPGRPR
jgi:hypothetical protein